jgi:hypothetical protein
LEFFPSRECEKYVKVLDNKKVFDIDSVPEEMIRNMSWINARVWPSIPNRQAARAPPMTFQLACEHVHEKFREKRKFAQMLREINESAIDDARDPESLINEELRKVCSMPAQPVSIMEAMMKLMGHNFVAESPSPKGKHRHQCTCGKITRHRRDEKPFVCDCGKVQSCRDEGGDHPSDRVNFPTTLCTDDTHFHECVRKNCSNKIPCRGGEPGTTVCNKCVVITGVEDQRVHETVRACQRSRDMGDFDFTGGKLLYSDMELWQQAMAELVLEDVSTFWDVLHDTYVNEVLEGVPIRNKLGQWILSGIAIGAMVAVAKWLGNSNEEPEGLTFEPESDPRRKIRHRGSKARSWSRSKTEYESEAKKAIVVSKLDVGHCVMNVIPIAERWILTYAHGLFDKGKFLPERHLILHHNRHV